MSRPLEKHSEAQLLWLKICKLVEIKLCTNQNFIFLKVEKFAENYLLQFFSDLLVLMIRQKHFCVRFLFPSTFSSCKSFRQLLLKSSTQSVVCSIKVLITAKSYRKGNKRKKKHISSSGCFQLLTFAAVCNISPFRNHFNTFNIFLFHFVWFMLFSFVLTGFFISE